MKKKTKVSIKTRPQTSILSSLVKKSDATVTSSKCVLSMGYDDDTNNTNDTNDISVPSTKVKKEVKVATSTPTPTLIPEADRKELLKDNIIKYMNTEKAPKPKKRNKPAKTDKTVVLESVNKIKCKEYVVTAIELQDSNKTCYYDKFNNVVDSERNIIGVYREGKVHLIDLGDY